MMALNPPPTHWGFVCGDGWYNLIDSACKELMEAGPPTPIAVGVKEKFGILRFDIEGGTEQHRKIIQHYQDLSKTVCEVCGEPGTLRTGGWLKTLCDKHNDERNQQ